MGFNSEIYQAVKSDFETKLNRKKQLAEKIKAEMHEKYPELKEYDNRLSDTMFEITSCIFSGKENVAKDIEKIKEKNLSTQNDRISFLKSKGIKENYDEPNYDCPKCKDEGFIDGKMCDCFKKAMTEKAFEMSGLGNLYKRQNFDNFSLDYYKGKDYELMSNNLLLAKTYADNFDPSSPSNLLFIGGTGLGKTHLSTAIAISVIEKGYSVVYETSQELFSIFEDERFHRSFDEQNEKTKADVCRECDLLIIDDLGTEISNNFTISCLYNLINSRMNSDKSTIINTNLSQKELDARYKERITSRLFGDYAPLLFTGTDIRQQKLND